VKPFDVARIRRVSVRADVEPRYLEREPTTMLGEPEVRIELGDETHAVPAADWPATPDFAAAADKLRRYARPVAGEARTKQIIDLVERLDTLQDVGALARLIAHG
jgi:hypothetical protein